MSHKINIISKMNGVGLDQSARLLAQCLSQHGFDIEISQHHRVKSARRYLQRNKTFDANIFMERVHPAWLGMAHKNFLIPNQERFPKRHIKYLKYIDSIFTKTRHANEIFSALFDDVEYIGFTSNDMSTTDKHSPNKKFLHFAGKSALKGTDTIVNVWKKHPEWPELTILQHRKNIEPIQLPNVNHILNKLELEQLKTILNEHTIHLCTSTAEGWGHYIVEAMSCSALVVTTDGPPMNELITDDRGMLVETQLHKDRHLGIEFFIDESAFEKTIAKINSLNATDILKLGENARKWFCINQEQFAKRLTNAISDRLGS